MPRNGSGQYDLPYDWNDDKANGIKVLASRMQTQDQDIATALTGSVASDGQTPLTGNIDFNGNKCVDLADGSNAADSINVSQAQTGELQFYGISTTTPAGTNGEDYDLGPTPAITVYPTYTRFSFVCHFTCIVNPNMRFGSLATKTLKKSDGASGYRALEAGDMVANKEYIGVINDDISSTDIIIENPENYSIESGVSQAITIATGAITIAKNYSSYSIDTEGAAATDDLDTISGGQDGQVIILNCANAARNVVLKHNTGNIYNPNAFNITLDLTTDFVVLRYNSTAVKWIVVSVSIFGSSPSVLISSQTASSSASVAFTGLSSQFAYYKVVLNNIVAASANAGLCCQVSTDGGSTWLNSSYKTIGYSISSTDAITGYVGNTTRFTINLGFDNNSDIDVPTDSNYGLCGEFNIFNPSASKYKVVDWKISYRENASTDLWQTNGSGSYEGSTTAINAIRFIMKQSNVDTNQGNIASGTFKLYGVI